MKKILLITLAITTLTFTGCKQDKKESKIEVKEATTLYNVDGETSQVKWVAYKTTDKVAVGGTFNTINIKNNLPASTIEEAINNTYFSIPVSSLFTENPTRDEKLKKFFFDVMDNTELISGEFNVSDQKTFLSIKMNGITKSFPIDLQLDGLEAVFTTTLNLKDWNLENALESINKACYDLHKGPDGVSKTWDVVDIKAIISLKIND